MNLCKKLCNECPFSNKSIPGWLADYSVEDIKELQNQEALFPCHLMIDENLSQEEAEEKIISGEMKLCRGYVESMKKSCKSPRTNKLLIEALNIVREEGVSSDSMTIWDFMKYHNNIVIKK